MGLVLVNGAAGFIGSCLVETFAARGFDVRATDLPGTDMEAARRLGADVVAADILDEESLDGLFDGVDIVVNAAALFDLASSYEVLRRVNVEGTSNMCTWAGRARVKRFVHLSTVAVYGRPEQIPCNETERQKPNNDYGRSKSEAEQVVFGCYEDYGLPVAVLRPTLVYGPGSRYGLAMHLALLTMMKYVGRKWIPFIRKGPMTHYVHVSDVAEAAVLAATDVRAIGHAFNVADDTPVTLEQMFRTLAEPVGLPVPKTVPYRSGIWRSAAGLAKLAIPVAMPLLNRRIDRIWNEMVDQYGLRRELNPRFDKAWLDFAVHDQQYDTSRIRDLGLRHRYPDFRDGMVETIKWYHDNAWLPDLGNLGGEGRD